MKKANYALFQSQSWTPSIGKMALLMVFAWCCCLGVQEVNAQDKQDDFVLTYNSKANKNTSTKYTLENCNDDVTSDDTRFLDDGSIDGNYVDSRPRADTIEICPKDAGHGVRVVFTDFDLSTGDFLCVFDGDRKAVRAGLAPGTGSGATAGSSFGPTGPVNGTGSGTGVSGAFGGWVDANCSRAVNPTGCLTFVFKTNGDNRKGAGWEAWVDCQETKTEFDGGSAVGTRLACDEVLGSVKITYPSITACGTEDSPGTVNVEIVKLSNGGDCISGSGAAGSMMTFNNLPIGQYEAKFTLGRNDKIKVSKFFAIQAKPLVANDDLSIPLGEACMIQLAPDDLLESPCPQLNVGGFTYMHYEMTIKLGNLAKNTLKTTYDTVGNVINPIFPIITKQAILDAGMSICGGSAQVTVERVYFKHKNAVDAVVAAGAECTPEEQRLSVTTTVNFKDISKPVISAPASNSLTIVGCDTTGLAEILGVKATDNCDDDISVDYTVLRDGNPCPDTTLITVIFSASDACGNSASITRTYQLERPKILGVNTTDPDYDRLVKTGDVSEDCSDAITAPLPGLQIGIRDMTVDTFIVKDTVFLSTEDYICGYILVKTDEEVPNTDCGSKTYEYFDVIDWCVSANGTTRIDTTYLELTDKTAPEFQGEEGTFTDDKGTSSDKDDRTFGMTPFAEIKLAAQACTFDITKYEGPSATDACSDVTVRINRIVRIENGEPWPVDPSEFTTLSCDSFRLEWIAEDACHEQLTEDTSYQVVEIKDVTAPSAICQNGFNVSVPADEGARLEISDIDNGSNDACGVANREIRIKDSGDDWADHVIIDCEDVHEEVLVELRITDKQGNTNTCWTTITAEDKIPPVCQNLENDTITCKDIHTGELGVSTDADGDGEMEASEWQPLTGDLMEAYNTRFGAPDCEDNLSCGTLTIEQEYQLIEEDCGALRARRRYRANDWKPNSSTWAEQLIIVDYVPEWAMTFPGDFEFTCEDQAIPAPATADDIITNGSCDLWALEVKADTFEVGDGVCMKIERTYELINWCVYEAGDAATVIAHNAEGTTVSSEGNEEVGRYTYTQIIKVYVTEKPTISIDDVNTCIVGVGDAVPFNEEDQTPGSFAYECDTIRTFSANATNCVGSALSQFEWKFYIDGVEVASGEGASFDHVVEPKVNYTVEFWAYDGCGNSAGTTKDFQFWDCRKPTPYVLNGIAIELGQTGTVDVWAADLDQGSYDNCTDQKDLEIYIKKDGFAGGPTDLAGVQALGKNITLGCDNVGTQTVSIYVVDAEGNWDVVETYILVQSNQFDCLAGEVTGGMVAGHIVNPNGENVEQVAVAVTGAKQESMTTGANGEFQFTLNTSADYTVTPVKDINPLNGVSTFDLVLISKHILGITTFDSPYKYIAADVNKSGSITAFDMVQLRQLILNINTEFTNNDSWRFVDAKHDFAASTDNPAAQDFAEFMTISQLAANMMDVDFVGVKIGDVNGNAAANSLLGAETRSTNGTLNINVTDRFVEAGETVTVDFKSTDIAAAQGYQFTMNFAGLNFDKLGEGVAKAANFNTNLAQRGMIATSWNGEATANDVLFSMTFNATAAGLLSELISVSSDLTAAEAYNTDGELLDVNLEFSTVATAAGFELGQNSPNPFNGETVIGFNLPKAGQATLKVMNVQGKVLKAITADYAKGYNMVVLKASELGATGVLHYQLESADQVATKKMIIIE